MASKKTKDIVTVFRELAKYAQPTSAFFSNQSTASTLIVKTNWSQRDLERSEKTTFSKTYVLSPDGNSGLRMVTTTTPQEISNVLWDRESPSGNFRAVVLKIKNKKGEEKQYLEIWNSSRKLKTFDVQSSEKHGKVYESDDQFGCLEWSPTEKYLVYIAEKKVPKAVSFFKEEKKPDGEDSKKEETVQGDEYLYREDWGEQLVDKHHPVPCIIDVQSGEITVLGNIPTDVSAGQACWAANDEGVVFIGWNHEPFRLGLKYCIQRKSGVYFVDAKNTNCTRLSVENRAVRSPRFNPERSQLFYLDTADTGAHSQCSRLLMYDWKKKTTSVVVDIVPSAKGDEFCGLYTSRLPDRGWLHGSKELVVDTFWRSRQVPTVINLETKAVKQMNTGPHEATCLTADVWNDYVILFASAPNQRIHLMVGKLEASGTKWLTLDDEEIKVPGVSYKVLQHQVTPDKVNAKYPDLDYESVLCLPTSPDLPPGYKPPLIVFPHGGPHTTFDVTFQMYTAGFCQCGYAVLMVNYRGSVGFGQNSIDSLLGNVGFQDVGDVWASATTVMESEEVDASRVFVFGGSHAGFLTTHLIGQYPGKFKAAACRNPVIDLTTMFGVSDIPDWIFEEAGRRFEYDSIVDSEMLAELWKRSPLSHVHKVKTPILLMIGKDDLRVPTKQARQYYRMLKARNQEVRFLAYDDNSHPIISVPAESDCFVNIMKWFTDHME